MSLEFSLFTSSLSTNLSGYKLNLRLPFISQNLSHDTCLQNKQPCNLPHIGIRHSIRSIKAISTDQTILNEDSEAPPFSPETAAVNEERQYKWAEAWYPIGMIANLDPKIPTAATILGRPVVIWWDKNSDSWKVFLDQCPHRLAPLSEGRIHESGQLQCSYHGWTFGGNGECGFIPQSAKETTKNSPRACAIPLPSVVAQGLLYVWPDMEPNNFERANQASPPHIPEWSDPSFTKEISTRDMSYGADTLMENLVDPAHVPFAHHKIMVGGRTQGTREGGRPMNLKVTSLKFEGFEGLTEFGTAEFKPPCLFIMRFILPRKEGEDASKPDKIASLIFYCVPTSPGYSRLFFSFPNNFLPKFLKLIPTWFRHLGQMLVLDSDMYFLHLQERRLEALGGSSKWPRSVFVPTASDAFVIGYRTWLNQFGGKGFDWPSYVDPKLPPTPPKEQLMDRYKSHVLQCKACKGAKSNFDKLQIIFGAISFSILAFLAVSGAVRRSSLPLPFSAGLAMTAGLFALASHKLGQWIYKTYYFHDYCHALVP